MRITENFETYQIPLEELIVRWDIETHLDPQEAKILLLYAEGYTLKEIAQQQQTSVYFVRRTLNAAIQHARELFRR